MVVYKKVWTTPGSANTSAQSHLLYLYFKIFFFSTPWSQGIHFSTRRLTHKLIRLATSKQPSVRCWVKLTRAPGPSLCRPPYQRSTSPLLRDARDRTDKVTSPHPPHKKKKSKKTTTAVRKRGTTKRATHSARRSTRAVKRRSNMGGASSQVYKNILQRQEQTTKKTLFLDSERHPGQTSWTS